VGIPAADANARDGALRRAVIAAAALLALARAMEADGGRLRLRQDSGPFTIAVFTAPEPLAVGAAEIGVLVQDRATGDVFLGADVTLRLSAPGSAPGEAVSAATGSNRLLRSAVVRFTTPGAWSLEVVVRRGGQTTSVRSVLPVGPPASRLAAIWPYLAAPPLAVALFAIGASRRRRT
jgi:hypothetical protein